MKAIADQNISLLDFLKKILDTASNTTVRKMIKQGRILVQQEPARRGDIMLEAGESVEVLPLSAVSRPQANVNAKAGRKGGSGLPWPILYEDEFIIAVRKPAGLLSIASDNERLKTLYRGVSDYVKANGGKFIFIVHRLDRDVSGVMLFAKDEQTKRKLQDDWHLVSKKYHAVVSGEPSKDNGTIKTWLCQNRANIVYVCDENTTDAKEAVTHYKVLSRHRTHSVLEVDIPTGRKHQIRVHLAHIGHPIIGDDLYGAKGEYTLPGLRRGIALHASELVFKHPVSQKKMTLKSELPPWKNLQKKSETPAGKKASASKNSRPESAEAKNKQKPKKA